MFGQYLVFGGALQNKFPEVTNRYQKEVSRILGVLNKRLECKKFMAGDEITIADIAMYPWIRVCELPFGAAMPLAKNERVKEWLDKMSARPAVQKELTIPQPFPLEEQMPAFANSVVGFGSLPKI